MHLGIHLILKNVIHQTKQPSSIAPLPISDAQGLQHYSWPLPPNKNVTRQLLSTFQIVKHYFRNISSLFF